MSQTKPTNGVNLEEAVHDLPTADHTNLLHRYQTSQSVIIPREVFEQLYFEPSAHRKGTRLGTIFGNPTPMPLMGFLIASMPLGCNLMGWRGSGGGGVAIVGLFYFFGGMLQIIGSVLEWILGNTFTYIVFACYGAFWLALGVTLTPAYDAQAYYDTQSGGSAEFAASFAFFHMCMALVTFFFCVGSIRTNLVLWLVFVFIDLAFIMLMAVYWTTAEGMTEVAGKLQIVSKGSQRINTRGPTSAN
ncbi:hypothetical protein SEUCBS139899_002175 [Sporothrix eucalyptigena]